jgi:F0F1-type ATP synthase membrane subunit b/b'
MEDQTAILSGSLQADPFETQMRGYNKRQVDDYISRTGEQVATLEARLAAAMDAAERARLEVAAVREQFQQQQAAIRPAHEEVSERLSQILRLAAEEAEQERANAEGEITGMRVQAEAEAESLIAGARAEADNVLAAAREEAETELTHAREEARRLLMSSQEEAEHTLTAAKEHAERLRGQAERRATAINGVLDQRLTALTEAHGSAVRRLAEIRDTVGGLLVDDSAVGPIVAGVPPVGQAELADAAAAGYRQPEEAFGVDPEGADPDGLGVAHLDGGMVEPVPDGSGTVRTGDAAPVGVVDLAGAVPQQASAQEDSAQEDTAQRIAEQRAAEPGSTDESLSVFRA